MKKGKERDLGDLIEKTRWIGDDSCSSSGSDGPPDADHHIFIGPQHPWTEEKLLE